MEEIDILKQKIDTLFEEIKSKDDVKYNDWLKQAILDHFSGLKVQDPPKRIKSSWFKGYFTMTRQDINYVLVHSLAFLLGYSMMMSQIHHNIPTVGFFDWDALNAGLIAAGVTNLGIGVAGK